MKFIFFVLLLLVSAGASAQCFNVSEPMWVRSCDVQPPTNEFGFPMNCPTTQPWMDLTGSLLLSPEPQETCSGIWIESGVADHSQAVVASVKNLETAFNEGVLAIVLALACVCFFVGLNSWEPAAK